MSFASQRERHCGSSVVLGNQDPVAPSAHVARTKKQAPMPFLVEKRAYCIWVRWSGVQILALLLLGGRSWCDMCQSQVLMQLHDSQVV